MRESGSPKRRSIRSRAKAALEYVERFPFRFGQFLLVTFERDHTPIDNKRDPELPHAEIPSDIRNGSVERLREARKNRSDE